MQYIVLSASPSDVVNVWKLVLIGLIANKLLAIMKMSISGNCVLMTFIII
ncbi:hypothetical protein M083_4785 [Bacteroides fragilis str. 3986 T(B)9]|nr:hypothetical protein M083_4785 [Bacteroides fragilis str. 3986 T(B)9]